MAKCKLVTVYHENNKSHALFFMSNKPEVIFSCDLEDIEILKNNDFYTHIGKNGKIYIRKNQKGKTIHFHREILKAGDYNKNNVVDHIDRNTLNNKKNNLRITNSLGNILNREGYNSERFLGIAGLKISFIKTRGIYQSYYNGKYLTASKDKKTLEFKILKLLNKESE